MVRAKHLNHFGSSTRWRLQRTENNPIFHIPFMGKRHTRSDSLTEHERYLKRVRVSVDSHQRVYFGLPLNPNLENPFPVDFVQVWDYLRKTADREDLISELSEDES